MIKRFLLLMTVSCLITLTGCGALSENAETGHKKEKESMIINSDKPDKSEENNDEDKLPEVKKISAEEAKELMEELEKNEYYLLDVRTLDEYQSGHIEGAILIPDYELEERAEGELTDKTKLILLYCRTGRRSAASAQVLMDLGYETIYDFGGIVDWPYEIETGNYGLIK